VLVCIVVFGGDPIIKSRMNIGFYGQLVVLIIIPTSWFLDLNEYYNYWLVLGCTAAVAVVTAFTASAAISLTSQYPPQVQAGYQLGIGLSTLLGSVFRIVTKLVVPDDMIVASSLLYFYGSAAAIAGCIAAYKVLQNLALSRKHVTYGLDPRSQVRMQSMMTPGASYDALAFLEHRAEEGAEVVAFAMPSPTRDGAVFDFEYCDIHEIDEPISEDSGMGGMGSGKSSPESVQSESSLLIQTVEIASQRRGASKFDVFCKVIPPLTSVFLVFGSTLVLWPSIITEINSNNFPYLEETNWWPLILLFLFALADCIGRFVVEYRKYVTKDTIWIFALMRLCLIPPLVGCAEGWAVFSNDAWPILFVVALGVSNGYLGSISIMLVNDYTSTKEETGIAGVFTGFIINAALATGATISLYLHDSLSLHNT
jgi:putative effector of murein hydrolase LrgA (UPF0299 family)